VDLTTVLTDSCSTIAVPDLEQLRCGPRSFSLPIRQAPIKACVAAQTGICFPLNGGRALIRGRRGGCYVSLPSLVV
jgi:hypothetical protein